MDFELQKKRYEQMPIDEFAFFMESYNRDDFVPEVQKVIEEVIEVRRKELDDYLQQKAEDDLIEEVESRVNGKLRSRKVTCKHCKFKGLIEAHDTKAYPEDRLFRLLGKDTEGYIHLRCPACKNDVAYSPTEFIF